MTRQPHGKPSATMQGMTACSGKVGVLGWVYEGEEGTDSFAVKCAVEQQRLHQEP